MYEQLPIVEVDLDALFLDLENYRLPTRPDDEAGALKYLFASEDVLGAARMIIRDGYFDNEVPIVIEAPSEPDDPPSYVVLEGNRRVSALKALRQTSLVPGHENELRALLTRYAVEADDLPERIRVLVAPDRATATPHVARLHTGLAKKPWSLDQQATFYYSLLDDQTTVDDVKAQYPDVDVARFMKMAVMRRFLAATSFSDHSLRGYVGSSDLRMSALEYAYRNKDIAAAIGAEFDRDGHLLPRESSPERIAAKLPEAKRRALEYLLSEFRAGRLSTRSIEFKKNNAAHQRFIDFLNDPSDPAVGTDSPHTSPSPAERLASEPQALSSPPPAPSGLQAQPFSASAGVDAVGEPDSVSPTDLLVGPGSRGPNHPDTKDKLDLTGLSYDRAHPNLKLRYFELRSINIGSHPMSATILLRSVLESTIKWHFESSPTPVRGQLNEVFKQVVASYGQAKALRATIQTIQSGDVQKHGSIPWFNLIAHSADAVVWKDDVHKAWRVVNPLLRFLLSRQSPPPPVTGT